MSRESPRFHRGSRALADPPRGDRAAAREVPGADRALLPGRHDPRPGGRRAGLAGRDGPRPAGAGAGPLEIAADPPRPGGLGRDDEPRARRSTRPPSALAAALIEATVRAAIGRSAATGLSCGRGLACSRPSSAKWPSPDGSGSSRPRADRRPRGRRGPLRSTRARQCSPPEVASIDREGRAGLAIRRRPSGRTTRSLTARSPGSGPRGSRPGR